MDVLAYVKIGEELVAVGQVAWPALRGLFASSGIPDAKLLEIDALYDERIKRAQDAADGK
jgi:hypothetical protein